MRVRVFPIDRDEDYARVSDLEMLVVEMQEIGKKQEDRFVEAVKEAGKEQQALFGGWQAEMAAKQDEMKQRMQALEAKFADMSQKMTTNSDRMVQINELTAAMKRMEDKIDEMAEQAVF